MFQNFFKLLSSELLDAHSVLPPQWRKLLLAMDSATDATVWGHPVVLYYKIHNICSSVKHNYLLCLWLKVHTWRPVSIKHDHHHQAIFIQRLKQYMDWDASAAVNYTWVITKWVFIIFMYGIPLYNVLRPIIITRCTAVNNQLKSYKIIKNIM